MERLTIINIGKNLLAHSFESRKRSTVQQEKLSQMYKHKHHYLLYHIWLKLYPQIYT